MAKVNRWIGLSQGEIDHSPDELRFQPSTRMAVGLNLYLRSSLYKLDLNLDLRFLISLCSRVMFVAELPERRQDEVEICLDESASENHGLRLDKKKTCKNKDKKTNLKLSSGIPSMSKLAERT